MKLSDLQRSCTGPEIQVGEVFGQRTFWVDNFGRLLPITWKVRKVTAPWTPGENIAVCQPHFTNEAYTIRYEHPEDSDIVPDPKCTCGFYAYTVTRLAMEDKLIGNSHASNNTGYPVTGVIAGYGRCLIGSRGFRAEKARVIAITPALDLGKSRDLDAACLEVQSLYSIPVYTSVDELLETHPLSRRADTDPNFWSNI